MSPPLSTNVNDVALIFEGGGMRASYTAAVVATLLNEGIHFGWVAGISAGASNLANYLARDPERARRSFVDFIGDPNIGDWRTFLRGQGLFNAHYIYEQSGGPNQALPYDFDTFVANPASLRIGAFECETGRQVYWTEDDMATMPDLMRRVRASSTMPIIMPPVRIGDNVYVDGALGPSAGIALDAAKADGFTRFFVVLTQTRDYVKSRVAVPALFNAYFRRYPAAAQAVNTRHERYNQTRSELFDLESDGSALLFVPDEMRVSNSTRDVDKLQASFDAGLDQARREVPRWRDFLGL